ncbi:hypothetical protein [Mycolicibacterium fortuitum]|uniref:hypothetical protein n=1 Tax=Mycolicibacterium fortuitum TaxID=1766 RepID=UPI001CDBCB2F|nr:hypothetical protein [Mycolicibacterium fortuitum]UBV14982.1 hypothetical protein H8Z57_30590 [Mycolicibacterium fortuitum]
MTTPTHAPLPLGFYDPHTHRSVVGYQPNGSPIWLTWRDSGGVVLVGDTGSGRTYLLNALLRGMEQDVDVTTHNIASDGTEAAIGKLRALADSFGGTAPKRPRLTVIDVEAVMGDNVSDLWDAASVVARHGRSHNSTVLISARGASYVPSRILGESATILALRQRSDRHVNALPEGMHAAVRAAREVPREEYPLVMSTWRSGVATNFPMPETHSTDCDCVERATALLTEHATHSAA